MNCRYYRKEIKCYPDIKCNRYEKRFCTYKHILAINQIIPNPRVAVKSDHNKTKNLRHLFILL
jgi:hypothetical protein